MSTTVTIEGSQTPSVFLAKGQRRTVQLTDRVQRLIDAGFVTVVEDGPATPMSEFAVSDPEPVAVPPADVPDANDGPLADDDDEPATAGNPPSRAASTATWRKFLADQHVDFSPVASRDQLIAAWEAAQA